MAITLHLEQVRVAVQDLPDDSKVLLFQDKQSGIMVTIPMDKKSAKHLSDDLASSSDIEISRVMPTAERAG